MKSALKKKKKKKKKKDSAVSLQMWYWNILYNEIIYGIFLFFPHILFQHIIHIFSNLSFSPFLKAAVLTVNASNDAYLPIPQFYLIYYLFFDCTSQNPWSHVHFNGSPYLSPTWSIFVESICNNKNRFTSSRFNI